MSSSASRPPRRPVNRNRLNAKAASALKSSCTKTTHTQTIRLLRAHVPKGCSSSSLEKLWRLNCCGISVEVTTLPRGFSEAETRYDTGNSAQMTAITPTRCRQPISRNQRLAPILTLGALSPPFPRLDASATGASSIGVVPGGGPWTCVMSVHILERAGGAELQGGDDAGDDEEHDRHRGGEADLHAAGAEGQSVGVADQDVGAARGGVVRAEGPAPGEQVDRRRSC